MALGFKIPGLDMEAIKHVGEQAKIFVEQTQTAFRGLGEHNREIYGKLKAVHDEVLSFREAAQRLELKLDAVLALRGALDVSEVKHDNGYGDHGNGGNGNGNIAGCGGGDTGNSSSGSGE